MREYYLYEQNGQQKEKEYCDCAVNECCHICELTEEDIMQGTIEEVDNGS